MRTITPAVELPQTPTLLDLLRGAAATLTTTERRLADHLHLHWQDLPLNSAAELAQEVGVNPSSVTRFAQTLGYRGYPDLQRAVRAELRARHAPRPLPAESHAAAHWQREIDAFQAVMRQPESALDDLTRHLAQARRVYVTGARGSAAAASYAAHLWHAVRPDVHLLTGPVLAHPEAWLDAGPADLLVAFTVRRYAQSTTALAGRFLGRGVPLALVTDSPVAPHARQAARLLVLPTPGQDGAGGADGRFVPLALPASASALLASKLVSLLGADRLNAAEQELGDLDVLTC